MKLSTVVYNHRKCKTSRQSYIRTRPKCYMLAMVVSTRVHSSFCTHDSESMDLAKFVIFLYLDLFDGYVKMDTHKRTHISYHVDFWHLHGGLT